MSNQPPPMPEPPIPEDDAEGNDNENERLTNAFRERIDSIFGIGPSDNAQLPRAYADALFILDQEVEGESLEWYLFVALLIAYTVAQPKRIITDAINFINAKGKDLIQAMEVLGVDISHSELIYTEDQYRMIANQERSFVEKIVREIQYNQTDPRDSFE